MPMTVLTRLLPDFDKALLKLTDDLSTIHASATWLFGEKLKDPQRSAIDDICSASVDSINTVQTLRKVFQALSSGQDAADELRQQAKPKPPRA